MFYNICSIIAYNASIVNMIFYYKLQNRINLLLCFNFVQIFDQADIQLVCDLHIEHLYGTERL